MFRWLPLLCLALCFASGARAQGLADCGFGFEIDAQSSAFQSMVVDGEQKRGFWLSINRAPADVREFARHIGRLQVCLVTPDGKPREITRGGQTFTLASPFLSNCTAALLPDNRLLTNVHCFYDQDLVRAGFSIVREARINFNYTSKDDTGAVRTYLVMPREIVLDKDLDAMVLQIIGGDANDDLGGHIPMRMMASVEPFQELRMIHHPGADPQQYSTGTCQVHRRQTEIPPERSPFRHSCESTGGSSGSLLLDARSLAVVALHNQGGLRPSGDSFNGGHKIALINKALNLGFQEVAPPAAQGTDAATRALTDALLIFDPAGQAEALRAVTARFPGTEAAEKAALALQRLEGDTDTARESAATQALSDALLTADLKGRAEALRTVMRQFSGTEAAEKAEAAATRLESDLARQDRDAEGKARLKAAQASGDLDALRALLDEFEGTPLGIDIRWALFEAETADRDRTAKATTALTDALLLSDRAERIAALERVTRDHAGLPAARQAAVALDQLRAAPLPQPAPAPKADDTPRPPASDLKELLVPLTPQDLTAMARRAGRTQADVLARGRLICGVNTGLTGFSHRDATGRWDGIDADFCRAVAVAVLDDPEAVDFVPLKAANRFIALASGEIDLLSRNTTHTFSRDVDLRFDFPGVLVFDGQAIMVLRNLGVTSATELDGASVCIQTGTRTELNLARYFQDNGMIYEPVPVETIAEAQQMYLAGTCDALTTDRTGLAVLRASFPDPANHIILPELLSREPLGPLVRHGDEDWTNIVGGVLNALKLADTMEIGSNRIVEVAEFLQTPDIRPETQGLVLGGRSLNLPDDMMLRIVQAVGNYGELFDRHLGSGSAIGLVRSGETYASSLDRSPEGELAFAHPDYTGPKKGSSTSILDIQNRGTLRCGVYNLVPPFSAYDPDYPDNRGGFGPALCRALSAAIFGDPDRVTWSIQSSETWAQSLRDGKLDIVPTAYGFGNEVFGQDRFTSQSVPLLYSGLGVVLRDDSGISEMRDLHGRKLCMIENAPHRAVTDHLVSDYDLKVTEEAGWNSGYHRFARNATDCVGFVNDMTELASAMLLSESGLDNQWIMPLDLPVQTVRAAMPSRSQEFRDLVNWTIYALIAAEDLGVTKDNVRDKARGNFLQPEINRLLGAEANLGAAMGLSPDWAVQAIAAVGNYGEIYDRVLGPGTGLDWDRGPNRLWRDGGLMFAPPFR